MGYHNEVPRPFTPKANHGKNSLPVRYTHPRSQETENFLSFVKRAKQEGYPAKDVKGCYRDIRQEILTAGYTRNSRWTEDRTRKHYVQNTVTYQG